MEIGINFDTVGIGLELAKLFIAEGARVIITGRNEIRLAEWELSFSNPLSEIYKNPE
ncbi:MAG: hypothetical protein AAFO04_26685 [Cyanobacteria bacterium J06592_8]